MLHWGGETALHSSSTVASSTTAASCTLPSSSQLQRVHPRRRCVLWRRKDCTQAFLLAMSASTSEEEGQALLLTTAASTSEEEGQALLLTTVASTLSTALRLARRMVRLGQFHLPDLIRPGVRCSFSSLSTVVSYCNDCCELFSSDDQQFEQRLSRNRVLASWCQAPVQCFMSMRLPVTFDLVLNSCVLHGAPTACDVLPGFGVAHLTFVITRKSRHLVSRHCS